MSKPKMYRFRDRLPQAGEGKAPRAEVAASINADGAVASLYLYDVIDSWGGFWGTSAAEVAAALAEIGNDVTELQLHVNSPGGEVFEAIAIKNLLAAHPAKVTAIVDGLAASAASFIVAAADTVVMGENTELMIHDALMVAYGNAGDFREYATELDRVSDNIASIYAKRTGGDATEWRQIMVAERWYSAQEAVDSGLADRVGIDEVEPAETEDQVSARIAAGLAAVGARHASRADAGQQPDRSGTSEPSTAPDVADRATNAARALVARHSFRERAARR